MKKTNKLYICHMLDMAEKATELIAGKIKDDFIADEALQFALAHMLQVIGEAARLISSDVQVGYLKIPWKAIIGMRHRIVHDYLNINVDIVWDTVTKDLQVLIPELRKLRDTVDSK